MNDGWFIRRDSIQQRLEHYRRASAKNQEKPRAGQDEREENPFTDSVSRLRKLRRALRRMILLQHCNSNPLLAQSCGPASPKLWGVTPGSELRLLLIWRNAR